VTDERKGTLDVIRRHVAFVPISNL